MASVHESLYFNPMMTNGVVHANVFGIKDWVTPYKISVLALLYEMTATKIPLPERRLLNKLILPLQQVRGRVSCRVVSCRGVAARTQRLIPVSSVWLRVQT